jgi:ABC-type transport system involved in multi-copper enzyme maturation permease subunit
MLGPIFNREALTLPRRTAHYRARGFYLGGLWVLGFTAWQVLYGWGQGISQGDLAYFGTAAFQLLAYSQLILVLFFAALIAANAVAQEKDRRTLILLLVSDLRDHEIVLGKLFGSLLQMSLLVTSSVPLLSLLLLLGGVSFAQVWNTFFIVLGCGIAAGSLGCLLAFWREKTYQALALTMLFLLLYLIGVEGLGVLAPRLGMAEAEAAAVLLRLNPFRALGWVVNPPAEGGSGPVYEFLAVMVALSIGLNLLTLWKLRVWNPSGEPIIKPDIEKEKAETVKAAEPEEERNVHAAPGKVREVWPNPILWREMRTRAYGRRPLLIKLMYLVLVCLIAGYALQQLAAPDRAMRLEPAYGLVPVLVLSMLLLNAQAVTAITSERDLNSLELLLVTQVTPKEFIFGKLGGIFYNAKEFLIPPLALLILYGLRGYAGLETLIYLLLAMLLLFAFMAMLGVYIGLRTLRSRVAIGNSLGTVFFLFVGTMLCIYLILVSGQFEYQFFSFLVFLAIGAIGLWWVLGGQHPSMAISVAAWLCPLGMFYTITNVLIGNPRTGQAGDPLWPFLVVMGVFGFTILAMAVPLLSEFKVALGHQAPVAEE